MLQISASSLNNNNNNSIYVNFASGGGLLLKYRVRVLTILQRKISVQVKPFFLVIALVSKIDFCGAYEYLHQWNSKLIPVNEDFFLTWKPLAWYQKELIIFYWAQIEIYTITSAALYWTKTIRANSEHVQLTLRGWKA